jgi:integrase
MAIRKDPKGRVLQKGELYRADRQRYAYKYKDALGNEKTIYSKDLAKLREREKELMKDSLDGINIYVAGKVTLNQCFDRYMERKHNLRENTRVNYIYMYNRFVRDTLGKKLLKNIVYSEVLAFYQMLLVKQKIAVNTLDTIHTVLHPTFAMAVRDNIIRTNPTDGVMAELKKDWGKNKGIRHALTHDQQKAFMDYIKNSEMYNHWHSVFAVLLGTGLRVGEFVGLTWNDVDFEKRTIKVDHALVYIYSRDTRDSSKTHARISKPKTEAGIRTIPMIDSVYDALQREYEIQKDFGFCTQKVDGYTNFIFFNRNGMAHNQQPLNAAIRRICDSYNVEEEVRAAKEKREPLILPKFSCHVLRHTFATRLCEVETNLKVIQSIMGHANIETTMDIYAEATKERNEEAMINFSEKWDVV